MTTASPRTKTLCILSSLTFSVAIAAMALAQAPASPHDLSDAVLQGNVEKAQQLIAAGADLEVLDVEDDRDGAFGGARGQVTVTLAVDVADSQRLAAVLADGDFVLTRVTGAPSAAGATPLDRTVPSGTASR